MCRLVQLATRKWLEVRNEIDKQKTEVLSLLSDRFISGEHENWKGCEVLNHMHGLF